MSFKVAIVGAGSLAHHLSYYLAEEEEVQIRQIYSRTLEDASELASDIGATTINDLNQLERDTDVIFLWVNDDNITKVSELLPRDLHEEVLIVHSSGTKSLEVIADNFENTACLWPIYSFSKAQRRRKLDDVPFCIEGSNDFSRKKIEVLARFLSAQIISVGAERKRVLHMAAVFMNNFTNHIATLTEDFLTAEELTLDYLSPIMEQTIEKAKKIGPQRAQTGPAIRKDIKTINAHLELLKENKDASELYKLISDQIMKRNA